MRRVLATFLLALAVPVTASADARQVRPDRPAIDALLAVFGPNDFGAADGAATASAPSGRLGAWVLALPIAVVGAIAAIAAGVAGARWRRRRSRIRAIERALAASR